MTHGENFHVDASVPMQEDNSFMQILNRKKNKALNEKTYFAFVKEAIHMDIHACK